MFWFWTVLLVVSSSTIAAHLTYVVVSYVIFMVTATAAKGEPLLTKPEKDVGLVAIEICNRANLLVPISAALAVFSLVMLFGQ
jgi:hypothetical protein